MIHPRQQWRSSVSRGGRQPEKKRPTECKLLAQFEVRTRPLQQIAVGQFRPTESARGLNLMTEKKTRQTFRSAMVKENAHPLLEGMKRR